MLLGEIDFRSVELEVLCRRHRVALHIAMVRRADATPSAASWSSPTRYRRSRAADTFPPPWPEIADWGHATALDDITGQVAIVGIGETAYTKASGRTASEIGAEAAERAIADAGLEPPDIDGLTYSGAFADFDVAAFHEHFGTDARDVDVAVGRRHGVGRDRAVPRRAGDRRGQGPSRAQRVPRGVGDAARRR